PSCVSASYDSSTYTSLFLLTATPTPHTYTLSLHDALPISHARLGRVRHDRGVRSDVGVDDATREIRADHVAHAAERGVVRMDGRDRKSTRLNSSHGSISYAVFCLKKKKELIISSEIGKRND